MPRLLTLNVANPPRARAEQLLHWLWAREESLWVLTEVGSGPGSLLLQSVCRAAGFAVHVTDCSELGVLTVAREGTLEEAPLRPTPILPGRVASLRWRPPVDAEPASATTEQPWTLRLLAAYGAASDPVRYSSKSQRERKRQWLHAFDAVVAEWVDGGPGLLLGDLNLVDPVHEDELGYVLPEETAFYHQLGQRHDLIDAFRLHHGTDPAISWVDHSGVGCRYDHAFTTPDLHVLGCDLVHGPREDGLSDHSALVIEVARE